MNKNMQKCIDALKELFRDLDARVLDLENNLCAKIEFCIRNNLGVIDAITDLINSLLPTAQTPFTCADVASCINNNADVRAALDARLGANTNLLNAWLNGANFLPGAGVRDKIANAKFSGLFDGDYVIKKVGGVYDLVANTGGVVTGSAAGRSIYHNGLFPNNGGIGQDISISFPISVPFLFNTISGQLYMESRSNPSNIFSASYIYDRISGLFIVGPTTGAFDTGGNQFCIHNIGSYQSANAIVSQCEDSLYKRTNRLTIDNITNSGFEVTFHRILDAIRTGTAIYGDEKLYMTIDAK